LSTDAGNQFTAVFKKNVNLPWERPQEWFDVLLAVSEALACVAVFRAAVGGRILNGKVPGRQ